MLAGYKVNGLMRLAMEDFEQPDIRLDYSGGTSGTYAGFDRFGRVTQQLWRNYGASVDADKVAYSYDRNSNRRYRENLLSSAKSELYAYDSLDRLTNFQRGTLDTNKTGISGTPANEEQFTLDAVGNWTGYLTKVDGTEDANQVRTHNKANEVTSISGTPDWADPTYDAAGNVKAFHTSDTPDFLHYDAWNRLVEYQYGGEDDQADYEYDGLNRRVRKSFGGWYNDYYYNISWQLLEVRRDGAAAAQEQYVWSLRYIDSPVLRDYDADGNAGTGGLGAAGSGMEQRVYYLTDGNFNVTGLADPNGAVLERYAYDAYGQARVYDPNGSPREYGSSYGNAILFCGYFRDAETGMYHVRHRYYHPQLGRWMSRDPIGYVDGMNGYEYAGGSPTVLLDPMGLSFWDSLIGMGDDVEQSKARSRALTEQMRAMLEALLKAATEKKKAGDNPIWDRIDDLRDRLKAADAWDQQLDKMFDEAIKQGLDEGGHDGTLGWLEGAGRVWGFEFGLDRYAYSRDSFNTGKVGGYFGGAALYLASCAEVSANPGVKIRISPPHAGGPHQYWHFQINYWITGIANSGRVWRWPG